MALHSDYCLIVRNGQLIASQMSGINDPIALTITDLKLLASHQIDDLYQNRFQFLKQAGLYTSDECKVAGPRKNLSEYATTEKHIANPVSVNMNFSVIGEGSSWLIWSAREGHWVVCDTKELTYLFLAVFDPQYVQNLGGAESDAYQRDCLIKFTSLGILMNARSKPAENNEVIQVIKEKPTVNQADLWTQLAVENKVPVYFVPHMQNHYPLALGVLFSAISDYNGGELLERFQLVPITYMDPHAFLNGPYKKFKEGVWLFSNYMWSMELNMQISQAIKQHSDHNLTIHGGPSTPEYPQACVDFMKEFDSVDVAVHGEGEVAIVEVLKNITRTASGELECDPDLKEVAGLTFRSVDTDSGLYRTVARKRTAQPDSVPSPYLSGFFDAYGSDVEAAIIESNRGCPFGCTFCDWGSATNQKVRKFDMERVKQEIDWIAERHVRVLWIADANYGLYDRDIELAQYIVDSKKKTGFPQEVVVNYTKNSTWRLVEIIQIFTAGGIISQGIISIQTTDEQTLEVINRKNIKTEKYDELTKVFYDLKLPLSTDLMMGLPGITVEGFDKDLQRYIDMDVSVKAYPTQLLPNSPMADPEYIEKYKIQTDKENFLIATYSYTESELHWMKGKYYLYTIADGYGLLRYVVRYLQWEHGIRAVDFLSDVMKTIQANPSKYPSLTWAVRFFVADKSMPGGWRQFYQCVAKFIQEQYDIPVDTGWETVYMVSELSMPDDGVVYPKTQALTHDFTAYFYSKSQKTKNQNVSLMDYPPAQFVVADPNKMVSIDMDYLQYDSHQYFYELHSDVARPKSTSEYAQ